MPAQDEYKVQLEVFEGPLDLLLYLIKKAEVDIYNIPIEKITTQYMEYLSVMRMLDLNIAGEFIVMAATLMMIKSRMLLPVDERPELEEEEGEDPRWDLVRQLLEYKKFKDAAGRLEEKEEEQENIFTAGARPLTAEADEAGVSLQDVGLFDLIAAFNEILKRARPEQIGEIFAERFTVADKIEYVLRTIAEKRNVRFQELFGESATRHEIVCIFLAILELVRLRHVNVRQDQHFGTIVICAAEQTAEV